MKTFKNRRGAAAVEMVITMVTLIPIIFFTLFLEDFVYYKLENQEPVVAAAWDHITPNYMKNTPDVGGMNRLKYCDHTAAYDSYTQDFDCNGAGGGATDGDEGDSGGMSQTGASSGLGHHHATGAHQCWLGGQQVKCSVSKGVEAAALPTSQPFIKYFGSGWNKGGIATCSAQLNVFNWIIPGNISREGGWLWSQKQMTDKTQYGKAGGGDRAGERGWAEDSNGQSKYSMGDAHKDGKNSQGSWLLAKYEFSVLVDPWALTDLEAVDPNKGGPATTQLPPGRFPGQDIYNPLLSRTGNYYNYYAKDAADTGKQWRESIEQKGYLADTSMFMGSGADTAGDSLASVPVYWDKPKQRSNNSGYASGYQDSRQKSYSPPDGNKFPSSWGPKSN